MVPNQVFFGYGGKSIKSGSNSGGGGGGGWFGGYSGTSGANAMGTGGSGGSGYIHNGTNSNSNLEPMFILHDPIHITGNSSMPCITESCSNEYGHQGDGFSRITLLSNPSSIHKYHPSCHITDSSTLFIILTILSSFIFLHT